MEIVPENTAISIGVATSAVDATQALPKGSRLLDYGAGKLRNASFLVQHGYDVSILETPLQLERLSPQSLQPYQSIYSTSDPIYEKYEMFDGILCTFVLNVITSQEERLKILSHIHQLLKKNGWLWVEVRKKQGIEKAKYKTPYEDGYLIGKHSVKTFQKPYEKDEIATFIEKQGFHITKIQSTSDGWLVVARKEEHDE